MLTLDWIGDREKKRKENGKKEKKKERKKEGKKERKKERKKESKKAMTKLYFFFDDFNAHVGEFVIGIERLLLAVACVLEHHNGEVWMRGFQTLAELVANRAVPPALVLHDQKPSYCISIIYSTVISLHHGRRVMYST